MKANNKSGNDSNVRKYNLIVRRSEFRSARIVFEDEAAEDEFGITAGLTGSLSRHAYDGRKGSDGDLFAVLKVSDGRFEALEINPDLTVEGFEEDTSEIKSIGATALGMIEDLDEYEFPFSAGFQRIGFEIEDDEPATDGGTELHVPDEDCVVLTDGGETPEERSERYEALCEELSRGEVVTYEYETEDGEVRSGRGAIAKSNSGGIRILPESGKRLLIVKYGFNVQSVNRDGGAARLRRSVGSEAVVQATGETVGIEYADHRGGWRFTEEFPEAATDGGEDQPESRYEQLREVYKDLIDEHEEVKSELREGFEDEVGGDIREVHLNGKKSGLIEAISEIEELLNQWDREDSNDG